MHSASLLVLAAGLFAGAPAPPDSPAEIDLEKLQGGWTLVKMVTNGEKLEGDQIPLQVAFCLKGEMLKVRPDSSQEFKPFGRLKIDPAKKPKAMDVTLDPEGGKKELARCIYELDGDTLRVAYLRVVTRDEYDADFCDARPTGFEMRPADSVRKPHLRVLVLKRCKM